MSRMRYHFSGVGGAGMSPLARLMRARAHPVQGSDRAFDAGRNGDAADALRAAGVELVPHDGRGITRGIDRFVFSTAVEAETPEMRAARGLGLTMIARPALLAELVNTGRPGVAVSGTSGKSTITGMLAWLVRESGAPAAVIGGAALVGEGGGGCLVTGPENRAVAAEADESDGTLVGYRPALGLIHNVSRDHTELEPLRKQFATFATQCGRLFVNARCAEASAIGRDVGATSYGVADGADAPVTPRALGPGRATGLLRWHGSDVALDVPQPGLHNLENAAAADDFAHNAEKIRAALTTAQAAAPRVVAAFQPHGFGPARFLRGELRELLPRLLRRDDRFCYAEIFYAGGTVTRDLSSRDLAADIGSAYAPDHAALVRWVAGEARPGDMVLLMGARDPELPRLARQVFAALA